MRQEGRGGGQLSYVIINRGDHSREKKRRGNLRKRKTVKSEIGCGERVNGAELYLIPSSQTGSSLVIIRQVGDVKTVPLRPENKSRLRYCSCLCGSLMVAKDAARPRVPYRLTPAEGTITRRIPRKTLGLPAADSPLRQRYYFRSDNPLFPSKYYGTVRP